jgi:hypothetical protein
MTADADPTGDAQSDRRAIWVGLRTLRQRPRYMGRTAGGEPVFDVRSVLLVLRPEAAQFNRLLQCSRCRTDVVGRRVFGPADLYQPPHPVICTKCVRTAPPLPPSTGQSRPAESSPRVPEPGRTKPAQAVAGTPAAGPAPVDEPRLVALEGRIDKLAAGLASVASTGQAQAKVIANSADARVPGVTELLHAQGEALAALSRAVADVRVEVGEWSQGILQAQRLLDARLSDLTRRLDRKDAAVDERIEELSAAAGAQASRLHLLQLQDAESMPRRSSRSEPA